MLSQESWSPRIRRYGPGAAGDILVSRNDQNPLAPWRGVGPGDHQSLVVRAMLCDLGDTEQQVHRTELRYST
jgi:hypothetical protein